MHHQGVFRVSGSQHEINEFKDAFERGTALLGYKGLEHVMTEP